MSIQTKGDLTRQSIKQALLRIQNNRPKIIGKERKISIASVAEEADVSRATIHNNYPEIAEKIRVLNNKTSRIQRDKRNQDLREMENKNKTLLVKIQKINTELNKLASINASLLIENSMLKNIIKSKNIHLL